MKSRRNDAAKTSGCMSLILLAGVLVAAVTIFGQLSDDKKPGATSLPPPDRAALRAAAAAATTTTTLAPARPQVEALVTRIVDGDTLNVLLDGKKDRVRLRNTNAPELDQPGGEEAKAALQTQFPAGSRVLLTIYARDAYGRAVAEVEAAPTKPATNASAPETAFTEYLKRCAVEKENLLTFAAEQLAVLQRDLVKMNNFSGRVTAADTARREDLKSRIQTLSNKIARIKQMSASEFPPPLNLDRLKQGDMGSIDANITVSQIVDDRTMLVMAGERMLFITGYSTANIADDDTIRYNVPFMVTGTQQYTTVLGARSTLWVLEPL